MTRFLLPLLGVGLLILITPLPAQDALSAAAVAERQDAEERYKRLNAAVEDLLAAQALIRTRIEALSEELRAVREENARAAGDRVSRDQLRELAEKVQELDKRREADKALILDEIRKLQKSSASTGARASSASLAPAEGPLKGYDYIVQKGDTSLEAIVRSYRKEGVKVTVDDVLKANPGLNPNRMQIGQKIFIPDPNR